ncbi:T9SS type A sorting domain-containing protein [Taibaiella soli]|uniref:Secretion system C-terminal sorting domain-containing protein n=1 Tax=Taibaiella soli TaxID=1649169 RepID=A0A2W2AVI1_9BACT|nr:T9SS type A sorting domain-containing protein [Taibaiella soli]PZF71688.1 hypothetical protein DN068_16600 [Taibaiella soli]
MKQLYTLAAILLCLEVVPASAKETGVAISGVFPHFNSSGLTSPSNGNVNTSTSRLIAKSHYVYDGSKLAAADSFSYIYSAGRGGNPDWEDANDDNVNFDTSVTYMFKYGYAYPSVRRMQTYNQQGLVASLWPQTWDGSNGDWENSKQYYYNYDNNYLLKTTMKMWFGGGWNNSLDYNNSYIYSPFRLLAMLNAPGYRRFFDYDANGNLVMSYDQTIQITGASQDNELDSFYYDSVTRLSAKTTQVHDSTTGGWMFSEHWDYDYTGTDSDVQSAYKLVWVNNAWAQSEYHIYTYDANHNMLSDLAKKWNGSVYVNASLTEWTYNTYSQPLTIVSRSWDGTAWNFATNDFTRNFYYENFVPTGIANLDKTPMFLNLYPSPATDVLNFGMNWEQPQQFNVAIYDMQGHVMKSWSENAVKTYNKQVALDGFNAGNYIVKMVAANGQQTTKMFTVNR